MSGFAYTPRLAVLAALLSAAVAAPAFAQEGPPPPPPPGYGDYGTFTGFHVEGLAGWDRFQNNGHKDGVAYGVGVGFDKQIGGALIGIEGEATDANTRRRTFDTFVAGDTLRVDAGRDLYIGGRIGTVVGGRTLLYVKAGYTNARIGVRYDDGTAAGLADYRDHADLDGVRAGAGAEYALTRNAYVKAEYRYSNYEKGYTRNQVLGGVGLRF